VTAETIPELVERLVRTVPDFPEPGIVFRDLTPVFADPTGLRRVIDALIEPFRGTFDVIAGIEARGFLLAAAAAYATGTGVVAVRKAGKLPGVVLSERYALEYGEAQLDLGEGIIAAGSRVLMLDDVLATGGTADATRRLLQRAGGEVIGLGVVMDLAELGGRSCLSDLQVVSLLTC
jgi:adenine phosphoribosyltransferase